jgi:hypothetical protein
VYFTATAGGSEEGWKLIIGVWKAKIEALQGTPLPQQPKSDVAVNVKAMKSPQ